MYKTFLQDLNRFGKAMSRVFNEWPNSCEHFLTNPSINRIAWLGKLEMNRRNQVKRLYEIKVTLQSIGLASISNKDSLKKFRPATKFKKLPAVEPKSELLLQQSVKTSPSPTNISKTDIFSRLDKKVRDIEARLVVRIDGEKHDLMIFSGITVKQLLLMIADMTAKQS